MKINYKNKSWTTGLISIISLISLTCLLLMLGGCSPSQAEEDYEETKPVVSVEEVVERDLREAVTLTAQISPRKNIQVMPEIPGRVEEEAVKVGDRVEKGQLLFQVANREQNLQLQQAQASLNTAQAQLEEGRAGARQQDLEQLQESVSQAKLNFEQTSREYERMAEMFEEDYISQQEYESIKVQVEVAESQYKSAQASLSMAEEGARAETIKSLEAQVEQARVSVDMAKNVYDKTYIKAPVSGTVAAVNLKEGEMASSSAPAAVLVDIDTVYVEASVPEGAINRIEEGMNIDVYVPAIQEEIFEGVVEEISLVAPEGSRSYPVKIVLDNEEGKLKGGMYARAEVPVETREQVPSISGEALVEDEETDQEHVFVVREGKAFLQEIVPGLRDKEHIEILEGLSLEDKVIVRGHQHLTDGSEVEILEGIN